MDTKYLFFITLVISIIVQIITGVIELLAFFIKVPIAYSLIRELLILELLVQIIEGGFYFWLAYNFTKIINVTPKRYIDWAITTPTMLITLILYLIYLNNKIKDEPDKLEFFILLKAIQAMVGLIKMFTTILTKSVWKHSSLEQTLSFIH